MYIYILGNQKETKKAKGAKKCDKKLISSSTFLRCTY